ncbi:MAG: transcription termination/antitermination factor NusG [Candidatus Ancillula sp.]|jgi:transcriptional antiterminator NusG|nr:transcription termination/antitermination factor NusG [Candidatus Ancillula sp.]
MSDKEYEAGKAKINELLDTLEGEWALVRCYGMREKSVAEAIERRIAAAGLEDTFFETMVPEETVIVADKDGNKKQISRVREPGYILVRMDTYDEETIVEVRRTNGVLGYAGDMYNPVPLSRDEVLRLIYPQNKSAVANPGVTAGEKQSGQKIEVNYEVGEVVRIIEGPFANQDATISELDLEQERVKVLVSVFGRETPTDLKINQIRKQTF